MPGLLKKTEELSTAKLRPAGSDDAIFTIDELIKRRASEFLDSPLLCFPREGITDYEEHSAQAIDRYVDAAVEALQRRGLEPANAALPQAPTVAILAPSSLQFIIALLGLNRLGYAALLLSPRLASPAIISLLEQAECDTILTTAQFYDALADVRSQKSIKLLEMLEHHDYYGVDAPVFHRTYDPEHENPKRAVIIHSSGSTGLPKPIYLTHRSCIATFALNLDRKALMTQPLFHSFGFYETFRSIYSGKPMYYVNYNFPITKQNLLATIEHVKPDLLFCVPYVLKLLADSDQGIKALADIDLIMYGGSACPDDLGDKLVKHGVNVCANYGATETGRVMTSVRPPGDDAWNYLRILPQVQQYLLMDEVAPNIFECVALDGLKSKSTINSNDPPNSFRTRDLFTPHPTKTNFWKYVSRLDDRLTLVNGEKVLPIPIEGRIRQEALVQEAIVFGDSKTVPGILVVKADAAAEMTDEEFLEHIWTSVEDANTRAESFSRIPRDLVVVLPPGTKYATTDKSTFIRAQVYEQFKQQIEDAYEKFENDTSGTVALPLPELQAYLLRRFREHLGVDIDSPETDFFAFGIDSLQCLRMWSLIKKEIDLGGKQAQVGQNLLYETGNIAALARYLHGLRTGETEDVQDQAQIMNDLVTKYSSFASITRPTDAKHVVALTGVTGGLGAHLLAQLVQNPQVSEVWALVRASSDLAALQRTLASLSARGLSLKQRELQKIVAVPSDLSKPDFGLGIDRLEDLRSKLTLVIHSAWAVNFNISVQSFENEHIAAVQKFINLCQTASHGAKARFFFCSSVSSAAGTPRPGTVPEGPVPDISHVQKTGYARSKYVAEHIVLNAAKQAGADARVLRIGQLAGDSKVGQWNTTEGIPLMIQTAVTLGALPALDEEMSWLPVDHAARIILDLCDAANAPSDSNSVIQTPPADLVYHVLNPTRFHWTRDMLPALAAAGFKFETLPTDQWMEKLRTSERDPKKNPPIKLLDWFESKYGHGASTKSKGPLEYQTQQTGKKSESMGGIPCVTDVGYVKLVIDRLQAQWAA
ncbi:acetyl-CoA synthetase-like protein [Bimuria novae-zelandiae CBS 107.79]|uniref:Acetyl-CoA synthetase-like protein n=1 Tax=Bimuria novae-zelandiae CBS 107.79 TaxID=1447943 RepID=A0A6A5VCC5_9PLEO|nr:acetyl-CoA synthetase-like protein [Bimuria novae-zelandiae CBS 107.79]